MEAKNILSSRMVCWLVEKTFHPEEFGDIEYEEWYTGSFADNGAGMVLNYRATNRAGNIVSGSINIMQDGKYLFPNTVINVDLQLPGSYAVKTYSYFSSQPIIFNQIKETIKTILK